MKPVTQRYVTVTEGTKFTAVVQNSHLPQYTGNGGLIVLMVDSMTFLPEAFMQKLPKQI